MNRILKRIEDLNKDRDKAQSKRMDTSHFIPKARELQDKLFEWVDSNTDWSAKNPFKGIAWEDDIDCAKKVLRKITKT